MTGEVVSLRENSNGRAGVVLAADNQRHVFYYWSIQDYSNLNEPRTSFTVGDKVKFKLVQLPACYRNEIEVRDMVLMPTVSLQQVDAVIHAVAPALKRSQSQEVALVETRRAIELREIPC